MQRGGQWLSQSAEVIAQAFEHWDREGRCPDGETEPPYFDVVVVGSGYGGAVGAKRLSALAETEGGSAMSVAVLERGVEYTPGSFPDRLADLVGHMRANGSGLIDAPLNGEGLMDWRLGGDVGALVANGLGGGSLINAGVCEPADDEVFTRAAWPEPWLGAKGLWQSLYGRASKNLGARKWPPARVPKQDAMKELARRLGATCDTATLSIVPPGAMPTDGTASSPPLAPCIECGDCFTGCNVGAKLTLTHNYLADAWRQGAQLFTGATVHSVLKIEHPTGAARWRVLWRLTDPGRLPRGQQFFELRARHVVLAAGTFGSTEIVMRSRDAGLRVSGRLGSGFSANGDVLSALYDLGQQVGGSPDEDSVPAKRRAGPTITQVLRWPTREDEEKRSPRVISNVVQDLTVPGPLRWMFSEILTTMMVPHRWPKWNLRQEYSGDADRYAVDGKAIDRSLLTVAYVDDGALGRLEPTVGWGSAERDGELVVRWPKVGDQAAFRKMNAKLAGTASDGVTFLHNPLWQFMPKENYLGLGQAKRRLLTVHPLGGCRMADNAREGVVNPFGAVFDTGKDLPDGALGEQRRTQRAGQHDRIVHDGLFILDGSIVPTSLGINPLLTITALAEGAIDQWQVDQGWHHASLPALRALPPLTLPVPRNAPRVVRPTAVRFQERMQGLLPDLPGNDPALDYRLSMRVRFAQVDDMQAFLATADRSLKLLARFEVRTEAKNMTKGSQPPVSQPVVGEKPFWLRGTVKWMAIEPSCVGQRLWRVGWNFVHHRLAADRAEARHVGRAPTEDLWSKLKGATHFGAVRLLAYEFEPLAQDWILNGKPGRAGYTLQKGTRLFGAKRVGYMLPDCRDPESANPWRQISELQLRAELPDGTQKDVALIEFDPMAALARYQLPVRVRAQQDGVAALRDMTSLALYFGRVMFGLHMFSFRRAEYPAEIRGPRQLKRLPPTCYDPADPRGFGALCIDVHGVEVQPSPPALPTPPARIPLDITTLRLRLTRLRRNPGSTRGLPVVLLHGFGSGGIQFTHSAITQPLAPWLACQDRDVWVAELRTSIGLESSRRQWTMDEVAREDIPALLRYVSDATGGGQVQVVAHCIGSAMFCMAALGGHLGRANPTGAGTQSLVAGAALMQVGPEVELPRNSRARAYVASRLRQLMGATEADSVASQDISDAESMLDRIVGTFLYPKKQRAHYRLTGNLLDNTNRTNANRSAAIFGQLFEYENMTPEVLTVMDDLLGSCNLTTYEQTAQYAYGHRLTNHAGEDVLVTTQRLEKHFRFPVFLLHGEKNETFLPRTLFRNEELLKRARIDVQKKMVEGFGHLDCVVGDTAAEHVFKPVAEHLDRVNGLVAAQVAAGFATTEAQQASSPEPPYPEEVRLPRVGPWLGHVERTDDGMLELKIGVRVDDPGRKLQGVASVLTVGKTPLTWLPQVDLLPRDRHETVVSTFLGKQVIGKTGPLQLLIGAVHAGWPGNSKDLVQKVFEKRKALRVDARRLGTACEVSTGLLLDQPWLARMFQDAPQDIGLVLGACRQRPLLFDRDRADASMGHVLRQLHEPATDGHVAIDAMLLAGDQVYADMRIETGHAGGAKTRLLDVHHEAWSSPYQREVMRRRPTYMVLDDHEFRNDYNDRVAISRPLEFASAQEVWRRYQLDAGPSRRKQTSAWRHFKLRDFAVFLCDTRSERSDPPTIDRSAARIMQNDQMKALQSWLLQLQHDTDYGKRAKVIVTGSPIAPWFSKANEGGGAAAASAVWSDGWQRFPRSVEDLLGFIAEHQITNVLFLSGDYHRHADVEMTLHGDAGQSVKARSIVTSGLYCPYPFVNATEDEWLMSPTGLHAGRFSWDYNVTTSTAGSGYTRLSLFKDGWVEASFFAVEGN